MAGEGSTADKQRPLSCAVVERRTWKSYTLPPSSPRVRRPADARCDRGDACAVCCNSARRPSEIRDRGRALRSRASLAGDPRARTSAVCRISAAARAARQASHRGTCGLCVLRGAAADVLCLQLGAGTAVLSVAVACAYDGVAEVLATDLPSVVPLLQRNCARVPADRSVRAAALPWGCELDAALRGPDLVLCCEIAYWGGWSLLCEDTRAPLRRTLLQLRGPNTVVLFACTLRDADRELGLVRALQDEDGWSCRCVPLCVRRRAVLTLTSAESRRAALRLIARKRVTCCCLCSHTPSVLDLQRQRSASLRSAGGSTRSLTVVPVYTRAICSCPPARCDASL